jgi:hypothetical protein
VKKYYDVFRLIDDKWLVDSYEYSKTYSLIDNLPEKVKEKVSVLLTAQDNYFDVNVGHRKSAHLFRVFMNDGGSEEASNK